jgi:hypothetical protein
LQERSALELGLEGFFSAPSRAIPKNSVERGEAFFSRGKGANRLLPREIQLPVLALAAQA